MGKELAELRSGSTRELDPSTGTGTSIRVLSRSLFAIAFLMLSLPLLAIISPVNHDETQYISAAYFVDLGLIPYRDFLHLQTPYQIYLFAPLFSMFEEDAFLAARLLSGAIGSAILMAVYLTLRQFRVDRTRAIVCCALLWLCHSFVFGVTVVRNDALPALLLTGAIFVIAKRPACDQETGGRFLTWAIAGVLLGIATGMKISYAASALAFAGFPLWAFLQKALSFRKALAQSALLGLGLVVALLPLLWFREVAQVAFDYGNFTYHAEAPLAWYAANGLEDRLTLFAKARDVLLTLVRGPAFVALLIYVWLRFRSLREGWLQIRLLLLIDLLLLAGLAATIAPTPTWRQYAIPLLPPLFVGLGIVWQQAHEHSIAVPRLAKAAMLLAAIVGIGQPVFQLWKGTVAGAATPVRIAREGKFLAAEAAAAGVSGTAASLSPQVILASGLALDATFATGPFAYRTGDTIPDEARAAMHITSPGSIIAYLDRTRPEVIVTGYENFDHVDEQGLELPIEAYASAHGYTRIDSPYGDAVFWFRSTKAEQAL
jgi:hypothetical protein